LVDSVGKQPDVSGKGRQEIDRRYVVSGRRRYDRRATRDPECRDDKTASRLAPKGRDGRFDLYVAMNGVMIATILRDRAAVSSEGI
jgi:hypothetical protein